jgi:superfamily II DNA helicase RecQ
LKQFAKLKPKTKEEMLNIEGVGKKFEKYCELFLKAIQILVINSI